MHTWGVIVCDRRVGPEHLCPIIALVLECDVLPDRQAQDMSLAGKTKSGNQCKLLGSQSMESGMGSCTGAECSTSVRFTTWNCTLLTIGRADSMDSLPSRTTKGLIKQLYATGVAGWRLDGT